MRVDVRLSAGYFVAMAFLSVMWGLGLVLHFLVNNRVFPRVLDADGVTTRSGRRHRWADLEDWERNRMVVGAGGPRLTGNLTLLFATGKVVIGSFPVGNLDEVLSFLGRKLGGPVATG